MGTSACDAIWLDGSNGSDLAQNEECKLEDDSCDFWAKSLWRGKTTIGHQKPHFAIGRPLVDH